MALKPQDIFMGIAVAVIWGMGVVFAKAAIAHFPPILLMAFRFTVTALVLVWFVKPLWGMMRRLMLIALVSAAIQYSLTFNGLKGLDASVAILVVQLEVPFLVILGILFLAEKPSLRKWAGIAAAFGGVALIAGGLKFANAWLPLLMIVGGTFTWAIGQVMVRKLGTVGGVTLTAWVAVFASPQLFAFSLVFEDNHLELIRAADWVVWGTVLYLGLVMTALGYGFWYTLIARHPIGRVAPFLMLMPVSAVAGGVFILGETLTMPTIIGGLIVIAAVTYIQMEKTA